MYSVWKTVQNGGGRDWSGPETEDRTRGSGPDAEDMTRGSGPDAEDRMRWSEPDAEDRMRWSGPETEDRTRGSGPDAEDRTRGSEPDAKGSISLSNSRAEEWPSDMFIKWELTIFLLTSSISIYRRKKRRRIVTFEKILAQRFCRISSEVAQFVFAYLLHSLFSKPICNAFICSLLNFFHTIFAKFQRFDPLTKDTISKISVLKAQSGENIPLSRKFLLQLYFSTILVL